MEMILIQNQTEQGSVEQAPLQVRTSVLDDLQLALVGYGMGIVIVG